MHRADVINTSKYPTDTVKQLVRYAKGDLECGHVAVNVKGSRDVFAGRAYNGIPSISNRRTTRADYLVVLRVGTADRFPYTDQYVKTAEPYRLESWQEALVYIAAHELMHCEQYERDRKRSEVECEMYAARTLKRWRDDNPIATRLRNMPGGRR